MCVQAGVCPKGNKFERAQRLSALGSEQCMGLLTKEAEDPKASAKPAAKPPAKRPRIQAKAKAKSVKWAFKSGSSRMVVDD